MNTGTCTTNEKSKEALLVRGIGGRQNKNQWYDSPASILELTCVFACAQRSMMCCLLNIVSPFLVTIIFTPELPWNFGTFRRIIWKSSENH